MQEPKHSSDKRDDRVNQHFRKIAQSDRLRPSFSLLPSTSDFINRSKQKKIILQLPQARNSGSNLFSHKKEQQNSSMSGTESVSSTTLSLNQQRQADVRLNLNPPQQHNTKLFGIILGVLMLTCIFSISTNSDQNQSEVQDCLSEFKKRQCGKDKNWTDQCSRLYNCLSSNSKGQENGQEYSKKIEELTKKIVEEEDDQFLGGFGTIITQILVFVLTTIAVIKKLLRNQRQGNHLGTAIELIRLHGGMLLRKQRNDENQ